VRIQLKSRAADTPVRFNTNPKTTPNFVTVKKKCCAINGATASLSLDHTTCQLCWFYISFNISFSLMDKRPDDDEEEEMRADTAQLHNGALF
jgi:hypothetical protein